MENRKSNAKGKQKIVLVVLTALLLTFPQSLVQAKYSSLPAQKVNLTAEDARAAEPDATIPEGMAGEGTAEAPYQITAVEQLQYMAAKIKNGVTYAGIHFQLMNDLDLKERAWDALGGNGKNSQYFSGLFDGAQHTITGLYINSADSYEGFFGYTVGGSIRNLTIEGTVHGSGDCVGGLTGAIRGTRIENCTSRVTVVSYGEKVGGIAGEGNGTIQNCINEGTITAKGNYVGGITGYMSDRGSIIANCINRGEITGESIVGGVIGASYQAFSNCSNEGSVTGELDVKIGGVVGFSITTVSHCANTGTISAKSASNSSEACVGGIAGISRAIGYCHNQGTVTGFSKTATGGIIGAVERLSGITRLPWVYSNYNEGSVVGGGKTAGAIAGADGNVNHPNEANAEMAVANYYTKGSAKQGIGGYIGDFTYCQTDEHFASMTLDELWLFNTANELYENRGDWVLTEDGIRLSDADHPGMFKLQVNQGNEKILYVYSDGTLYTSKSGYLKGGSTLLLECREGYEFETLSINGEQIADVQYQSRYEWILENRDMTIEATFTSEGIAATTEAIAAIGETITTDSRKLVDTAREAYEDLTWREKRLMGEEPVAVLEAAETMLDYLESFQVELAQTSMPYNGQPRQPAMTLRQKTETGLVDLVRGLDYSVEYSDNVQAGTAMGEISLWGDYQSKGKIRFRFTVKATPLKTCTISLKTTSYTHNGKARKPSVTVKSDGAVLKNGTDYKVSYSSNVNPGTGKVTITGIGNVSGSVTKTFKIQAAKGKTYTVGDLKYKVTAVGSKGTVSVAGVKDKKLKKVTIPASVKIGKDTYTVNQVEKNALANCKNLKDITVKSTKIKSVGANALKGIYKKAVIKVPSSKYKTYAKLFANKGQAKTVVIKK